MSNSNQSSITSDAEPSEATTAKMRVEDLKKQFGRVVALNKVTLDIKDNEIFGLVGDNGAGKSTLLGILNGLHQPTSGYVYYEGEQVEFTTPQDARELGIETVYQDLALMNDLDVASNIFMGMFPKRGFGPLSYIDWKETYRQAEKIMHETLERDIPVHAEVEHLSGGERQLVAIARALTFDPDVVILDEPTSALAVNATRLVHDTIRRLKQEGHTVIVVSHSLESVLEFSDRIGVLYQGEIVTVTEPANADLESLNDAMVAGRVHE